MMKVRPTIAGVIVFMALGAASCSTVVDIGPGVRGSGNLTTQTRDVTGFDGVVLLGSADVNIDVTGAESLTVETDDNILPLLTTEVRDGVLELGSESNISPTRVTYTITVASLDSVRITGSGTITISNLGADDFAAEVAGSGTISPSGTTNSLDVNISGSGAYAGSQLESATATVEISGSGKAVVSVTGELDATINGSGDITYLGDPVVSSSVNGSGAIAQG